jgi:hypothetical protein
MAKHKLIKDALSFKSDTLYRPNTTNTFRYYTSYSIYRFLAYKDSPGKVVGVQVWAPNPVEAYIAVLDMGYTPVDNTIHKDLRKW